MIEKWAREEILQHNALMYGALQLVMAANGHCENSLSIKIAEMLEQYEVCPDTGDMKEVKP